MRYLVVVEESLTSCGAWVPDLPGCAVVGETRAEALALVREAIEMHVEDLRVRGEPVPVPQSSGEVVEVAPA